MERTDVRYWGGKTEGRWGWRRRRWQLLDKFRTDYSWNLNTSQQIDLFGELLFGMDNGPNWCITLKERQRVGEDEEEDVSSYWIKFWTKWLFWKLKYETTGRPLWRTCCGGDYSPNWRSTQKEIQEVEEDLSSYWIYLLTRSIPGHIDLCEEVALELTMDQTVVRQWRKDRRKMRMK